MTNEQIEKIKLAMAETAKLLIMYEKQKTFDKYQENKKQDNIKKYSIHLRNLANMLLT